VALVSARQHSHILTTVLSGGLISPRTSVCPLGARVVIDLGLTESINKGQVNGVRVNVIDLTRSTLSWEPVIPAVPIAMTTSSTESIGRFASVVSTGIDLRSDI